MIRIIAVLFLLATPHMLFAQTSSLQSIEGAFGFPIDEDQLAVRISINPNSLNRKGEMAKTLSQFVVVACYEGECRFATPNSGLGFFETKFPAKVARKNNFNLSVVACSRLGCIKKQLTALVIYPNDKL